LTHATDETETMTESVQAVKQITSKMDAATTQQLYEVLTDNYSNDTSNNNTRMWANAQLDGHPAEYRWRPLFNAAKFG